MSEFDPKLASEIVSEYSSEMAKLSLPPRSKRIFHNLNDAQLLLRLVRKHRLQKQHLPNLLSALRSQGFFVVSDALAEPAQKAKVNSAVAEYLASRGIRGDFDKLHELAYRHQIPTLVLRNVLGHFRVRVLGDRRGEASQVHGSANMVGKPSGSPGREGRRGLRG